METVKTYYQQRRKEMLAYIPPDIRRTLEVGCGEGIFSEQLKDNFGAETWGVEHQADVAELAAQKLHCVLAGSFEDAISKLPHQYFDCIIFNDVLEHLVDPYSALIMAKDLLDTGGVIVASIPNIRHWPEFVDYTWRGNWTYRDHGVLDRTHLRFFTQKSIIRTVENCDYELLNMQGIRPYHSLAQRMASLLSLGRLTDTLYKQYAIVIRPKNHVHD